MKLAFWLEIPSLVGIENLESEADGGAGVDHVVDEDAVQVAHLARDLEQTLHHRRGEPN